MVAHCSLLDAADMRSRVHNTTTHAHDIISRAWHAPGDMVIEQKNEWIVRDWGPLLWEQQIDGLTPVVLRFVHALNVVWRANKHFSNMFVYIYHTIRRHTLEINKL